MKKNIFFDLDGTILNSQRRSYDLFCELSQQQEISFDTYWAIKRQRINQKDFLQKYLSYSDEECEHFKKQWLSKIEDPQRLKSDVPVENIENIFDKLALKNTLFIVTHRQKKNETIEQIKSLGWNKYFNKILVSEQKSSKAELVLQHLTPCSDDVFIGDTGDDIITAKTLCIKSVAVTYGILNEAVLTEYKPDFLIRGVSEFDNCPIL